jgi:endonuclease/exonuclease/phosphatase (EEP) superfamily protein YafD
MGPSAAGHWLWRATQLAALAGTISTALSYLAGHHWAAEVLASLRVQQVLGLSIVLVACTAFGKWRWAGWMLLCVAAHLPWFLAPTPHDAAAVPAPATSFKITLANVLTSNLRHADIVAAIREQDADIVVIVELSSSLAAHLSRELWESHPYEIVRPQDDGNFGIGLYSRFPIQDPEVLTLVSRIPSIAVTLRLPQGDQRLFATHPFPPVGERGFELRNAQIRQLAARIHADRLKNPSMPIVLAGDLNLTPWSPFFEELERDSGLRRAGIEQRLAPTWYLWPLFPFGLLLDHALASPDLACTKRIIGPDIGSDHRPVTFTMRRI